MGAAHVTVAAGAGDPADHVGRLARLGFEFGEPAPFDTTLLDTFDGRAQRAGISVELVADTGYLLVVRRGDEEVRVDVSRAPRFGRDLPPGRLFGRLARLIGVRALLPRMRLTGSARTGRRRNRSGRVVAVAVVSEGLVIDGYEGADLPEWIIEIDGPSDAQKAARRARAALEEAGVASRRGDTLSAAAAAAHLDLGGIRDTPTVPLDPSMSAVDGLRAVLANLATTIGANWQGTIEQIDPEFLHDLRVAVRRTRTVVGHGTRILPPVVATWAAALFGRLADLTGPARDLDVTLLDWDEQVGRLSATAIEALRPVRTIFETRHAAAMSELTDALRSDELREHLATWIAWLHDPERVIAAGGNDGDGPVPRSGAGNDRVEQADRQLGPAVARAIRRRHRLLVERGRLITAESPAEAVHDLRKDAKKLRYLLECFGSLFPPELLETAVRQLRALQDNLGEHQDADVQAAALRAIAADLEGDADFDTMLALGRLTARADQRKTAARHDFARRFATYDSAATEDIFRKALRALRRTR